MSRFLCKFLCVLAVLQLLVLNACAITPPVQEMSNARQSIQAAVDVGAEQYAAETLGEARQLLAQASDELESGNYSLARQHALEAKEQALKARHAALKRKKE